MDKKYIKSTRSLNATQKQYEKTKSLSTIEVKEYSILCLILKNINFFSINFNLLDELKLFTKENSLILEKIKSEIKIQEKLSIADLSIDHQIIEKILNFASIRYILDKKNLSDEKILEMFNEIMRDLKNFELEVRIEELESKFSKDFNENTFNELKELKKLQKIN